jgi:hypothetical protein
MSAALIVTVSWVALTKVVVRSAPFQRTTDPTTKLLPVTVSVKSAPPEGMLVGESVLRAGVGLLMVNTETLEVPPPGRGLKTETEADPAVAISLAGIAASSWPAFT